MADFEVTLSGANLKDLLTRDDGLRGLVEDVLNQVLEAQMTEHIGAGRMSALSPDRPIATDIGRGSFTVGWGRYRFGCPRAETAASRPRYSSAISVRSRPWFWP